MGELAQSADLIVIGAGPGGYVAAIRAAQLGRRVLLVDKDKQLGGICLHHGCIPSKALINAANMVNAIKNDAPLMGIKVGKPTVNKEKMQKWKQGIIDKLVKGIEGLLAKHKIEVVYGAAVFESSKRLRINSKDGHRTVNFKHCIIATGSRPTEIPNFKFDETIVSSTGALKFKKIPKTLVVIGGGYIGCELGIVYAKLGSKVTIIQRGERLLPFVSQDITSILEHHMEELGINILFKASAESAKKHKSYAEVVISKDGKKQMLKAEKVLVAVGRKPNSQELGLDKTKIKVDDRGFIQADNQQRTADPRIFAIGDVIGGAALAHKASTEGKVAAEVIAGKPAAFDQIIPSVIFTDLEIAIVGLDELKAKEQGYEVKVGKFPFAASGRALTMNHTSGFVKMIADAKTDVLLGVHIIGPKATDLISEAALAIEMGATLTDLALTIHPHPTLPETLMEAAEATNKIAIHLYQGKKD